MLQKTTLLMSCAAFMIATPAMADMHKDKTEHDKLEFSKLDADKDGEISKNEFMSLAEVETPATAFSRADEDNNEVLTEEELEKFKKTKEPYSGERPEKGMHEKDM